MIRSHLYPLPRGMPLHMGIDGHLAMSGYRYFGKVMLELVHACADKDKVKLPPQVSAHGDMTSCKIGTASDRFFNKIVPSVT